VFYLSGINVGIMTAPADNLFIFNNQFYGSNYECGISLGVTGFQGTFINSNIWIAGNLFNNVCHPLCIAGNGQNEVSSVIISNNLDTGYASGSKPFCSSYNTTTSTNVLITANNGGFLSNLATSGQWFIDAGNNNFLSCVLNDTVGITNTLYYSEGTKWQTPYTAFSSVYVLDDTFGPLLLPNSILTLVNNSVYSYPVYLSASMAGAPITMVSGTTLNFCWTGSAWTTNWPTSIQVTPGILACGTNDLGTASTNSVTVENIGGGTLTGSASVGAPFSILSGETYSLGPYQSQTVVVTFSSGVAGNYNQNLTFTGGGGSAIILSGSAIDNPVGPPSDLKVSLKTTN
jgi:hypothetical protein